jgi:hypothetical protein
MLIGYARVSTLEQTLALQQDALTKAGCERLFTDTASGSLTERPGLTEVLGFARPGDTLVVWRLDRLGRSLRHLIDTERYSQRFPTAAVELQRGDDADDVGKLGEAAAVSGGEDFPVLEVSDGAFHGGSELGVVAVGDLASSRELSSGWFPAGRDDECSLVGEVAESRRRGK